MYFVVVFSVVLIRSSKGLFLCIAVVLKVYLEMASCVSVVQFYFIFYLVSRFAV